MILDALRIAIHAPRMLKRRGFFQVNPDIGGQHSLKDGPAHPDYLKPNFFRAERMYKPCERRKLS